MFLEIRNGVLEEQMKWGSRNRGKRIQDASQKGSRATKRQKNQPSPSKEFFYFQGNAVWVPIQCLILHCCNTLFGLDFALVNALYLCWLENSANIIYDLVQDDCIKCQELYTTNSLLFLSVRKTGNELCDLTSQC